MGRRCVDPPLRTCSCEITSSPLWLVGVDHRMFGPSGSAYDQRWLFAAPGCWKKPGMGFLHFLSDLRCLDSACTASLVYMHGRHVPVRHGGHTAAAAQRIRALIQLPVPSECPRGGPRNSCAGVCAD